MFFQFILLALACFIAQTSPAHSNSLPKIIWTYSEQPQSSNMLHQLCIEKLTSDLNQNQQGWTVRIITPDNLFTYLHDSERYIKLTRKFGTKQQFSESIFIIKLFILKQHGGFWVDPTVIFTGALDWVGHLDQIKVVNQFGGKQFQIVLFSGVGQEAQASLSEQEQVVKTKMVKQFKLQSTGLIIALKQSQILKQWINQIQNNYFIQQQFDYQNDATLQQNISVTMFNQVLENYNKKAAKGKNKTNKKTAIEYFQIWQFQYLDLKLSFQKFAGDDDQMVIADFYIKYDRHAIFQKFGKSTYFINLKGHEQALQLMINQNVSSLAYRNCLPAFQFICRKQESQCAHFILQNSIIGHYLLSSSNLQQSKQIEMKSVDEVKHCLSAHGNFTMLQWKFAIVAGCLFCLLLFTLRVQLIVVDIMIKRGKQRAINKWETMKQNYYNVIIKLQNQQLSMI